MAAPWWDKNKRGGGEFGGGPTDQLKRQRTDRAPPSAVMHVRGLPSFTSEIELITLVQPYGQVVKCLLLQAKQQAFVQMESVAAAQQVVASSDANQMHIRGKQIFFQFSNKHSAVTTKSGGTGVEGDFKTVAAAGTETANAILLVSILNARVPVTLENIHQVFKPYGEVLKIITFMKDNVFQALVQMGSVESAINAKLLLEGKDMFQGCCTLRIAFSSRTTLAVKQQGAKSRDFQQPYTPGAGGPAASASATGLFGGVGSVPALGSVGGFLGASSDPYGAWLASLGGGAAYPQAANQQMLQQLQQSHTLGGAAGAAGPSPVVLVNKLDGRATPDMLFTLFGLYGDVQRVKILYNKRDTAMIQFSNPQQAQLAVANLNGVPLYGSSLVVSASKNFEVKMPRPEQEEAHAGLTKDYHGSPLHRYKKTGGLNPKNVNAPSQVLHIANIYEGCTESELSQVFSAIQPEKAAPLVQFFTTNRKMAYVRMDSISDAVQGLIQCHNHKLGSWNMRVSFSHKDGATMGTDIAAKAEPQESDEGKQDTATTV